jgi:hypothetical protein
MKKLVREAMHLLLIVLGVFSAAFGLKGFLLSSRFIDGGVTGVSMLLSNVLGWPLWRCMLRSHCVRSPTVREGYLKPRTLQKARWRLPGLRVPD